MVELHFSLIFLLAKLHFSLFWLLGKLHFSLFWLLGKLHFFLISKFRGVLPSYYRKWRNGETENARKTRWSVARGNVWTVRTKDFSRYRFVPRPKHFSRRRDLKKGELTAKLVPLCTKKGRRRKNVKRNRARGARFHLSHLYVFQGYMHFLQTLHSWGLKFDYQRG